MIFTACLPRWWAETLTVFNPGGVSQTVVDKTIIVAIWETTGLNMKRQGPVVW